MVLASENVTEISSNSTEPDIESAANALFQEYWELILEDSPITATRLGHHQYDDKLECCSLKCIEKRKVMTTEFLERASQLLPLTTEGSETHHNVQFFIMVLQFKIDDLMSGSYLFPYNNIQTPEMTLRYILKYTTLKEPKDYWNLISRYLAFPQMIDEYIELMREGIRTNYTLHEKSLLSPGSRVEQNCTVLESPHFKPFLKFDSSISEEEAFSIQQNASDAVENSLLPALKKLEDFIEEEYRPNTRPEIGISTLPGGEEFYRHYLIQHLSDNSVTAEKIHAMGLAEVDRISQEMDEVIHSMGLNLTRKEFSDQLRNDSSQHFDNEEEALETYRNTITNEITPKLGRIFKKIPGKILNVESVPKELSSGPRAYYMRASPDNVIPATFFLDTSEIWNLPRYEVMTLAIHEGVPGHHFQISYAMEQENVPDFRRHGISSTAYVEGWALYAEYLGYELGLYEDPLQRYGHLSEEMFRACRMVVDTGMHVFGWNRQRAIDFMLEYSASTLGNIEREVDRYITWPGQACAYKYGEMKIKELRNGTETALGKEFDIREFHDLVLQNNGPLELLERQVDSYIRRTKINEINS